MLNEPTYIIIIGAARSGTKLLRDVLGVAGNTRVVPYDVSFIWRYGNENKPDDCLLIEDCSPKIGDYVRSNISRLAVGSGDQTCTRIIEKTVANTLRVGFVERVFPSSLYIHLVRDGRDVIESAYRQWQAPPDWHYLVKKAQLFPWRNARYALWYARNLIRGSLRSGQRVSIWGPRYPNIESDVRKNDLLTVCARQWSSCIDYACQGLSNIPVDRQITIRYEDFVADRGVLRALIGFAGLSDHAEIEAVYDRTIQTGFTGRWKMSPLRPNFQQVDAVIRPTLSRLGYT